MVGLILHRRREARMGLLLVGVLRLLVLRGGVGRGGLVGSIAHGQPVPGYRSCEPEVVERRLGTSATAGNQAAGPPGATPIQGAAQPGSRRWSSKMPRDHRGSNRCLTGRQTSGGFDGSARGTAGLTPIQTDPA